MKQDGLASLFLGKICEYQNLYVLQCQTQHWAYLGCSGNLSRRWTLFMTLSLLQLNSFCRCYSVCGSIRNILTLRLENILCNVHSAKAFDSSNAPNCFLLKLALWTIVMRFTFYTRSSLLMFWEYVSAGLSNFCFSCSSEYFGYSKSSSRWQLSVWLHWNKL